MSRGVRLFLFLVLFGLASWGIFPSIRYYFFTDSKVQQMVEKQQDSLYLDKQTNISAEEKSAILSQLERAYKDKKGAVSAGLDIKGGIRVAIEADFEKMATMRGTTVSELSEAQKTDAIDQIKKRIETRINQFGVSETKIRKLDEKRIEIEIPGVSTSDRLMRVIDTVGDLNFRLVNEEFYQKGSLDIERTETGSIVVLNKEIVPDDSEILIYRTKDEIGKLVEVEAMVVYKTNRPYSFMSGNRISDAKKQMGQYGDNTVGFTLDMKGSTIFTEITAKNIEKRLAIVLDSYILSAPKINSIISGSGEITGNFSDEDAAELALILRSGSLPVPIKFISEEVVGPEMGQEELMKSISALLLGLLAIFIFMLIKYRLSGIVACLALVLNGVVIFALLAPLHYTVTLPGIAGLILTMGMAIDANVLIFERIKEEMKEHKRDLTDAIPIGFEKAFFSILDGNLTTLIAAAILARYGTGVIQGFAVVLFFGIVVSMFTALGFSRLVLELFIKFGLTRKNNRLIL